MSYVECLILCQVHIFKYVYSVTTKQIQKYAGPSLIKITLKHSASSAQGTSHFSTTKEKPFNTVWGHNSCSF
jgi:hypothetical protein